MFGFQHKLMDLCVDALGGGPRVQAWDGKNTYTSFRAEPFQSDAGKGRRDDRVLLSLGLGTLNHRGRTTCRGSGRCLIGRGK